MMDFSFIVPVYNCRETLSACVQSILRAQIPASEILLIDDGSTDGSGKLCEDLSRQHPQIKVLHQANLGAAAARNAGLAACTGNRILFADADDILDPTALKQVLSGELCAYTDLTVFGMEFCYLLHGRPVKREFYPNISGGVFSAASWGKQLPEWFRANALSSLCSKVFKRSIIECNRLRLNPRLTLYEDLDFVLNYLSFCNEIRILPAPVYRYHLPADSRKSHGRLALLDRIPSCLEPVEASLHRLMVHNQALSPCDCSLILESLYLMLVRQKMTTVDMTGIRKMCRDYIVWENRGLPSPTESALRSRLCSMDVYSLYVQSKLGAIRQRLGIWYRWILSWTRKDAYGH